MRGTLYPSVKVRIPSRSCPRQDSNLRTALRRRVLYPLSYEGVSGEFSNGVCVARAESGERRRPGRYP